MSITTTDLSNNLIAQMFDLPKVKERIASCAENEVVILCPNWSINEPKYPDTADIEQRDWDFSELETYLGTPLYVSDYNDLIADPHGVYNY